MSDNESASAAPAPSSDATGSSGLTSGDDTNSITSSVFDALERDESPAASSAVDRGASDPPAAGTTAPPVAPPVVVPAPLGGIPPDRHKAILERTREESTRRGRQEAEHELRQRYGDPTRVEQALQFFDWVASDPDGFHAEFQRQRSRAVGPPPPDLRAEDGTLVYSAPQFDKRIAWERDQLLKQVEQTYAPVQQHVAEVKRQQLDAAVLQQAKGTVEDARANWPLFKDLEADIKRQMISNQVLTLPEAYIAVYAAKGRVLDQERIRAQHTGTLADKSAAGTARPGVAPATPREYRHMSTRDITAEVFDQIDAATR